MVNLFYLDKNPKKCAQFYCDKHVVKISVEIAQILSQIHHIFGETEPPYKSCRAVSKSLSPLKWAMESISNYLYCCNLGIELINEYKFRYNKDTHKCLDVLIWLKNNIPKKIKKKNRTKFKLTNNIKVYSEYFTDPVEASKFMYVDYKCKNDKWTKRNQPEWFNTYLIQSNKEKEILKEKIMDNVRNKLPEFSRKNRLTVRRFHSFLRVCYDNMFEDKWDRKILELKNMFDPKKPLIGQLGLGHLKKVYDISNSLFDIKVLDELNKNSLIYRGKLKDNYKIQL